MPLYDTECIECGAAQEHVILSSESPPYVCPCAECGDDTEHRKLPGLCRPARYLGDRRCAPQVYGGMHCDTMGYRSTGQDPPYGLDELCAMTPEDNRAAVKSKEFDAWTSDEIKMLRENSAKRARAKAIKAGANVDMRTNPLPGDPKI